MKKIIKIMFSLSVLLLMSCVEEIDYSLPRNEVSRNITTVSSDTITNHELLEEFSKALAYSLDSSIEASIGKSTRIDFFECFQLPSK